MKHWDVIKNEGERKYLARWLWKSSGLKMTRRSQSSKDYGEHSRPWGEQEQQLWNKTSLMGLRGRKKAENGTRWGQRSRQGTWLFKNSSESSLGACRLESSRLWVPLILRPLFLWTSRICQLRREKRGWDSAPEPVCVPASPLTILVFNSVIHPSTKGLHLEIIKDSFNSNVL